MFNYIGILHKSTAINHVISCNFLPNTSLNLILSKNNIIEIYNLTSNGLQTTPYLNIFGNIIILENIPSNKIPKDNLFILTEDLDFAIMSSSKEGKIENLVKGTIKEDIGKKQDKVLYSLNNDKNYIIISAYKNVFNVICVNVQKREQNKDFILRYDYENILFMQPFNLNNFIKQSNDTINFAIIKTSLILNNSNNDENQINNNALTQTIEFQSLEINIQTCTLSSPKIEDNKKNLPLNVTIYKGSNEKTINTHDKEVNMLQTIDLISNPTVNLMITHPSGIVILFFSNYLSLYQYNNKSKKLEKQNFTCSYSDRKFVAFTKIEESTYRYLVIDMFGNLFLLALKNPWNDSNIKMNNEVIFQFIGEVNYCSNLCYLDNGYIFIGSNLSNSQLIKIEEKIPNLKVIVEFESLAPINDFVVVNNSNEENAIEILSISGTDKNCSIKTISKGTSILFNGEIKIKGIKSAFKIEYKDRNTMDIDSGKKRNKIVTLIISTILKSICIDINNDYEFYINKNIKFEEGELIVFACNNNSINILITNRNIYIYDEFLNLRSKKNFNDNEKPLLVKYHRKSNSIYIYNSNNDLLKYNIENDSINEVKTILKNVYISAFDVSSHFLIYGLWESNNIFIYSFISNSNEDNNQILCSIDENVEYIQISSIQILKKDGVKFFFISLSNGKMLYYKLKPQFRNVPNYIFTKNDFIFKRKYNITSESFSIKKIKNKLNGENNIFLDSPTPSFIYINKENLVISNFNIKNCNNIFDIYNSYLFVFNDCISFGSLSNTQSQNVQTKKYGYQLYNICLITFNQNKNMTFIGMISEEKEMGITRGFFIFSDLNLKEISRYRFEYDYEVGTSFCEIDNNKESNNKLIVIGTGIIENISSEPILGHLYLLLIDGENNYNIKKLYETETRGGVYKVNYKNNIIYCAIGNTLYLYSLIENISNNYYEFKSIRKISEFTLINDISFLNDEYLVISDVYRSISIYSYKPENEKFNEICRDYYPTWIYGITQCLNDTLYTSDIDGNIITLKKSLHPKSDEEKYKLERKACFNFGERINKMISTKIKAKDLKEISVFENNENDEVNIVYFGTLNGSIGVIIQLNKETFEFLEKLQEIIISKTYNNGAFDYKKWRSFKDGFISEESFGFVEGNILEDFLNFDDDYRKKILKELNYPWQKNINDVINMIETLVKYH